ncbi:hypothetical protein F2Q69_00051476 [Brassica cretica]|uniref:Uncharacterized protein n=1 Tax=Brassica cretica TaxID=69181 RepID=A0A8S9Q174_BRACR|nr:hypothetical protein F2Q69_00051476 [Brassica cretica]
MEESKQPMSSPGGDECLSWAARDPSGLLSPHTFTRRSVTSDDVSLKITHCGVCYADVIWTKNKHGDSKYPLVPGYVFLNNTHLLLKLPTLTFPNVFI